MRCRNVKDEAALAHVGMLLQGVRRMKKNKKKIDTDNILELSTIERMISPNNSNLLVSMMEAEVGIQPVNDLRTSRQIGASPASSDSP